MNLFAEMFRSKASSADPLSPVMLNDPPLKPRFCCIVRIATQYRWGEGKGKVIASSPFKGEVRACPVLDTGRGMGICRQPRRLFYG